LAEIAESLEAMHIASESNDPHTVKHQGQAYLDGIQPLLRRLEKGGKQRGTDSISPLFRLRRGGRAITPGRGVAGRAHAQGLKVRSGQVLAGTRRDTALSFTIPGRFRAAGGAAPLAFARLVSHEFLPCARR